MKTNNHTKYIAQMGLLACLAMILGYVESLLPLFAGAPGIKLGLANLVTVFVLYVFSWREAFLVSIIRILGVSFLFGNMSGLMFSLAGGFCSVACMSLLKERKQPLFSVVGISVIGGVVHNLAQLFVASLVVEQFRILYYLPILLFSGTLTGLLIGVVSKELIGRLGPILKNHG